MTLRKQPQAEVWLIISRLKIFSLYWLRTLQQPYLVNNGGVVGGSAPQWAASDILFISLNDRLNDISAVLADASALPIRQFPLPTP